LGPDPVADAALDLVADSPERRESLIVAARGLGWVLEAPVQAAGLLRKHRTCLVGGVTYRDHIVPRLLRECVDELRRVPAEIDAGLGHGSHRERMNTCGLSSGARDLEAVCRQRAEKSLGHLTPCGVVRTEEEDSLLVHAAVSM